METYWEYELGKIATTSGKDHVRVKLISDITETKWLSLTPEQFEKLEAFLLSIEEAK
jgi:hypothetical protein